MATSPVYSKVLWQLEPGYTLPGPVFGPSVPTGFTWVVRDVAAFHAAPANNGGPAGQLQLQNGAGTFWATPRATSQIGELYTTNDMRVVLEALDSLVVSTSDPNWLLQVYGYNLTNT